MLNISTSVPIVEGHLSELAQATGKYVMTLYQIHVLFCVCTSEQKRKRKVVNIKDKLKILDL